MIEAPTTSALPGLAQRLGIAASVLLDDDQARAADGAADAGTLLDVLVDSVASQPGRGRLWLLLVALSSTFPASEQVIEAGRRLELDARQDFLLWLLREAASWAIEAGEPGAEMDIVADRPVIDVDFSARFELMTGIQRVVRETVSRWVGEHEVTLAVWNDGGGGYRRPSPLDEARLLRWHEHMRTPPGRRTEPAVRLVVPWGVPIVVPEVPSTEHSVRLASVARHSGCPVLTVGYDAIPLVSPEFVDEGQHLKFNAYLGVVKYARVVACISQSAASEFDGFASMLAAQGLAGPEVVVCPLPNHTPVVSDERPNGGDLPIVLCVGSPDRRKNQLAVLEAAEQLWRDGRLFALRFIGSGGWAPVELWERIAELTERGRPVTAEFELADEEVAAAYDEARFTVFPSLHEGFGLPVVESLSHGTPVITSNYGSLAECAGDGGALLVDPRDPDELQGAMRLLLDDDGRLSELRAAARTRPRRTWDDYAEALWEVLLGVGAGW